MCRISKFGLAPLFTTLLIAAYGPSWQNTPVPQWTEEDAKQLLADSPWVKTVQLDQVRNLSKFERRDGGDWEAGIGGGIGLAGTGIFGSLRQAQALARARARARKDLGTVVVRWESASPVRAAESRVGETEVPAWQGDYYAVAVYNIPCQSKWNLANELKGVAFIKRDQKKDIKPSRVILLPKDDDIMTVVYLFPRSVEITKRDRSLTFVAQIRRLFVYQNFFPEDMQLHGELQL